MTNASGQKTRLRETMTPEPAELTTIRNYHRRTKHRFEAYAPGPETLDWDDQPAPFRHFEGATEVVLAKLQEAARNASIAAALRRPYSTLGFPGPKVEASQESLSVLLQLGLGITAWKSYGPDRWAVRANPSSGNLHPVEAYVFLRAMPDLADGLYHYCPDTHTLECRAEFTPSTAAPQILVALSTVMWREAWKYGERAFRYCQLDTGHAVGALRYAAAVLRWPLAEQSLAATTQLAQWLGLDRAMEFAAGRSPHTEREEAEILMSLTEAPADLAWLDESSQTARWHGKASVIDPHPMYRWPVIEEVAEATRQHAESSKMFKRVLANPGNAPPDTDIPAASLILRRRSAQRFDARHTMPLQDFYALLSAVLPHRNVPFDALSSPPRISLVLFVHRVEGLQPGLYLLPRSAELAERLDRGLDARFLRQPVAGAPAHLGLQLLTPVATAELHRVARSLNCHQDIASNACFALAMLAEFDPVIAGDAGAYRDVFREAGLIGQALYLDAEARGLRGTGIGCYFDDPLHDMLGLQDEQLQSLYHFTVGLALDDIRIETTIPDHMRLPS